MSDIERLSALISQYVQVIANACSGQGITLPDLNSPFDKDADTAFRDVPGVTDAVNIIAAAAAQLTAALLPPAHQLQNIGGGHAAASALRIAHETSITEILRDAGPQGLHVNDIAQINGLDANKLAHYLRLLAFHHVFREISPDVFANNRLSALMDSGFPVKDLITDPDLRFSKSDGLGPILSLMLNDWLKASSYVFDASTDPQTAKSTEHKDAPFARAYGLPVLEWIAAPGNEKTSMRYANGMKAKESIQPGEAVLLGFPWASLPSEALIVDVGGGVGGAMMSLFKAFPHLRFAVQDTTKMIEIGHQTWNRQFPDAITSGRVALQVHDFFQPQTIKNADVFFLRAVAHNWSDGPLVTILKHLRDAATPKTKLVIVEWILPYACANSSIEEVPGAVPAKPAPPPLLPNYGYPNITCFQHDAMMIGMVNAMERTYDQFKSVLNAAGWKISSVHANHAWPSVYPHIEAIVA